MIERVVIELKTQKAAKEFGAALDEAMDTGEASLVRVSEKTVTVEWSADLDPTEMLEAVASARDEMEWDFD